MAGPAVQAIDCDAHCAPASIDVLLPYFDDYWHDYVADAGVQLSSTVTGAYPAGARTSGTAATTTVEELAEQLLDPRDARYAVLNCLSAFDASRNAYYEAALARAKRRADSVVVTGQPSDSLAMVAGEAPLGSVSSVVTVVSLRCR